MDYLLTQTTKKTTKLLIVDTETIVDRQDVSQNFIYLSQELKDSEQKEVRNLHKEALTYYPNAKVDIHPISLSSANFEETVASLDIDPWIEMFNEAKEYQHVIVNCREGVYTSLLSDPTTTSLHNIMHEHLKNMNINLVWVVGDVAQGREELRFFNGIIQSEPTRFSRFFLINNPKASYNIKSFRDFYKKHSNFLKTLKAHNVASEYFPIHSTLIKDHVAGCLTEKTDLITSILPKQIIQKITVKRPDIAQLLKQFRKQYFCMWDNLQQNKSITTLKTKTIIRSTKKQIL